MGPKYEVACEGAARSWQVREVDSGNLAAEYPLVVHMSPTGAIESIDGRAAAEYECARLNQEADGQREAVALGVVTAVQMLLSKIPEEWTMLDPEFEGPLSAPVPHQLAVDIGRQAGAVDWAVHQFVESRRR